MPSDADRPSNQAPDVRREFDAARNTENQGRAQLLLASTRDEYFVLDFVAVDELRWLDIQPRHPFTISVSVPPSLHREVATIAGWTSSVAVVHLCQLAVGSDDASWLVIEDADMMVLLRCAKP